MGLNYLARCPSVPRLFHVSNEAVPCMHPRVAGERCRSEWGCPLPLVSLSVMSQLDISGSFTFSNGLSAP